MMNESRLDNPALRILQILPDLNAGGVERTTVEIVEALTEAGHTAHVLSAGGRLETEIKALGGILHSASIGSKNVLTVIPRILQIAKLVKAHNINVIHARSRAPAWPAYFAAKLTNTAFVTTYHGIYNANNSLKRFYNSVMAKGDAVIANSEFTKAHILKTHKCAPDKITVIHRGVDMKRFDPMTVSQEAITAQRLEWGTERDKLIVLPGRLTRWKGQLDAIEALAELPEFCRLILVGDPQGRDDYVAEVKAKAQSLGLSDRVILAGHRPDMPLILAAADIVLSASNEPEAFGRIAAEAQAMGRPVVATALGGALETVKDEETGWLVPAHDSVAMAKAIRKAIAWPSYDGGKARSRIARYFSKKSLQLRTIGVYRAVIR
ncbi:glycosyltransferase involved in cell wall biosynthesis [Litorimonas taeanensis]|uniref:Glycosyltransferase involved in cell wall biosynthesis n=1 Tax=Litorimonas taeanensis TaxID=568099 RepID=A0A420WLG6_9PROT|nr:glycosyltransferase family 4 protein [Litorimonas taeanensis]RKQ71819.1 glycosyltransferase involved in cell wall biosynthesis [Litorimonas taeanensis]